jgi:hypothetical protein
MTDRPEFGREMLAAMSNRRVRDVRDITGRLEFHTKDTTQAAVDKLIKSMFQYRLLRWLHGTGHLEPLRGTHIPEDVYNAERDDTLVRARLLLRSLSDSDLLPLDPYFCLTVCGFFLFLSLFLIVNSSR